MAINFPSSPTLNQQVTLAGVIWTYDGKGWFPAASTQAITTAFNKVAVAGQTTVQATTGDDTLTLAAGQNITLNTDAATERVTINATGNLQVQSGYTASRQTFTATGTSSVFTLTATPTTADNLLVFVSGVQQPRSYYSLSGNNVTLGGVPSAGEEIDIIDLSSGISVMGVNRVIQNAVAVAGQTTVTVNGGYTVGQIDVYVNGVMLFSDEYTASDGVIVSFSSPLGADDEVRLIKYQPLRVNPTDFVIKRETFTALQGQLTFTTVNGYNTGYVDVYLNGIRLVETVDFVAIDGQTVTLTEGADVDDVLLVQTYYATNSTTITSANLIITGAVDLGQVSNVSMSGGSAGQYLVSNGTNGLTFTSNINTPVANIKITGGTNGQAIVTDGTGNLSFSTATGISTGKSIAMAIIFGG